MVNGLHAIVINVYDVHVYYTMFFGFEIYKNQNQMYAYSDYFTYLPQDIYEENI